MELVKSNGRLVSGTPCIYHLLGGVIFYAEDVREDGDSLIFDPAKTVALLFEPPDAKGQQRFVRIKGFGPQIPLMPSSLRAYKGGILVTDCTDANVIALCKQTLSGIIIAPAGARMPPGETAH
jgi:hypothetical protein